MNDILLNSDFLFQLNPLRFCTGIIAVYFGTFILNKAYTKFIPSNDNKNHIVAHIDFFALAIFFIVSVIKTSLALSLGLVGALSIIRFRTAIKEPGQIILLLVVTAVSLAAAAEKEVMALILPLLYYVRSYFFKKERKKLTKSSRRTLRLSVLKSNLNSLEVHTEEFFSRLLVSEEHATIEFMEVSSEVIDSILNKYSAFIEEYEII